MWQKNARYLDYNAGAGLALSVRSECARLMGDPDFFVANPSSRHRLGQRMQSLLYRAQLAIAGSLARAGSSPDSTPDSFIDQLIDQLVFTSSGTEANQTVLRSGWKENTWLAIGAGEHSASHDFLHHEFSARHPLGARRIEIPLFSTGQVDLDQFYNLLIQLQSGHGKERETSTSSELTPKEIWLSLAWANNETGVLLDLEAVRGALKKIQSAFADTRVRLHLDGAQVWGKIPVELSSTPADFVTFSGHKIGAPAGVGLIWAREPQLLEPLIFGNQNRGLRAGTENVLGIHLLGVAAASQASPEAVQRFQKHTQALRDRFESKLLETGIRVKIWGRETQRVSNTSRVSFEDYTGYENWVELIDMRGFAVSHGSACQAQVIAPSRVLLKMGATEAQALNSIRVSFGPESQIQDVDDLVACLVELDQNKKKRS